MATLYTLKTTAPDFYVLTRDGRSVRVNGTEVFNATRNPLVARELKTLHGRWGKLFPRKARREAFRALKRPWPLFGGAPEVYPYHLLP